MGINSKRELLPVIPGALPQNQMRCWSWYPVKQWLFFDNILLKYWKTYHSNAPVRGQCNIRLANILVTIPGRYFGQCAEVMTNGKPTEDQPKNANYCNGTWHIFKTTTNHNHVNMTIRYNQMHINIRIAIRINNTTTILMPMKNHAILNVLYISKYASFGTGICIDRSKTKYTNLPTIVRIF